jgi:hypothetical protein
MVHGAQWSERDHVGGCNKVPPSHNQLVKDGGGGAATAAESNEKRCS